MAVGKIPHATAKRLPIYYRYLNILADEGVEHISSRDFAVRINIDATTIRRDFAYFGQLGTRGFGYNVHSLLRFFRKALYQDHLTHVALIGVGNLGRALLNYNFQQTNNIRISAAFDTDPEITGTIQTGVPVYSMEDLEQQIKDQQIKIAILATPVTAAQDITDALVEAGVEGIMNFSTTRVNVPGSVDVKYIDLANELQSLIFFVANRDERFE